MHSLFITSSAFTALNNHQDTNHKSAVQFVNSLFRETIKLYTSLVEVVIAADRIQSERGKAKAQKFLRLLGEDAICMLTSRDDPFDRGVEKWSRTRPKAGIVPALNQALAVELMHQYSLKDVFSFDPGYTRFDVIVWPKLDS